MVALVDKYAGGCFYGMIGTWEFFPRNYNTIGDTMKRSDLQSLAIQTANDLVRGEFSVTRGLCESTSLSEGVDFLNLTLDAIPKSIDALDELGFPDAVKPSAEAVKSRLRSAQRTTFSRWKNGKTSTVPRWFKADEGVEFRDGKFYILILDEETVKANKAKREKAAADKAAAAAAEAEKAAAAAAELLLADSEAVKKAASKRVEKAEKAASKQVESAKTELANVTSELMAVREQLRKITNERDNLKNERDFLRTQLDKVTKSRDKFAKAVNDKKAVEKAAEMLAA